jgi:hypothetical protein
MVRLLVAFANWLQSTPLALNIAGSDWAYPPVQALHFTGLSLWVGTNVALDLRLMGVRKQHRTISELSDALFVWNWIGFGIAVLGGFLLFSTAAGRYIYNPAFRVKLGILIPLGLVLHIVNQRRAHAWSQTLAPPTVAKIAGLTELLLWFSVATAAVSIPYF